MTEQPLSLTVTLETVTPLFLGGADPRSAPELRPPSFRGALRYWLRAALGGVLGDNLKALKRAEAEVFGSTDEKEGASAVTLRLSNLQLSAPQEYQKQKPLHVVKHGKPMRQPTGRDYLYWSMGKFGGQEPKQFYAPNSQFDVVLRTRPGVKDADEKFRQAATALWLLIQLGGIGSRARRTGGSLCAHRKAEAGLTFELTAQTINEVACQLGEGLTVIRRHSMAAGKVHPHVPSAFDVLHPSVARIWVLGMWNTAESAVETIGSALRDFRERRDPDHRNVAKWLNGEKITTVERAAFGLPLMYRYSDGGPSGTVQGRTKPPSIERRASPLWLKVSKTAQGKHVGVATLFNSEFLPKGEMLYAKTKGTPPPITPPENYDLIVKWIETQFGERIEVHYD